MKLHRSAMVESLDARIEVTGDERHRANLAVVREHMVGEIAEDIDALLRTLSPDPVYHTWGAAPELSPQGTERVRRFYEERAAAGHLYFQYDIEHLVVTDDIVVTDGVMTSLVPARGMLQYGIPDDDTVYKLVVRMAIFWPIDPDGLVIGEESHSSLLSFDAVDPADLPTDFPSQPAPAGP
ncbi:hypothetical protein CcI49_18350 [Frankia sp. CcI49]|uniref:nuclear transport factor 2 family protein n=1 Tax=Frankia sp. CcI49 TaxID=1745382 RepID=UPI000978550C|nr:nuclear transport factor 2 family protein [Frankia sp. CcI49]ONH59105.1 hypothetical protein CcI49_18350 [Frankia sp. CcI49]